jgi:hypothetical protein
MITSSRSDQSQHEGYLALGITAWMRGEDGPDAVAAGRIVAETILLWRRIMESKFER